MYENKATVQSYPIITEIMNSSHHSAERKAPSDIPETDYGPLFVENPLARKALLAFATLALANVLVALKTLEPVQDEIETGRLIYGTITSLAFVPVMPIFICYLMDVMDRNWGLTKQCRESIEEVMTKTASAAEHENADLSETAAD